jgi:diguanylate cyclase (GGDEF)-like protein
MRETEAMARSSDEAEKRTRHIFWGSLVLCALIVVQIAYMSKDPAGLRGAMRSFLPSVLLWSLCMTGYAFYTLSRISRAKPSAVPEFADVATGVFTLPYLASCLNHEHKRAQEAGQSAVVVYLDLMHLERVNQNAGHAVGDIVLKAMAQLIAHSVRSGDVVGRVGGDEFLIVMPETTMRQARPIVQSIKEAIAGYRLDLGKKGVVDFLGCQVGMAVFPAEGDTPDSIVAAARARVGRQEEAPAT